MASEKGVLASGLESDSQATRRRNVPSTSSNGGMVNRVEIDDKKTQIKKVRAADGRQIAVDRAGQSFTQSC